MKTVFTFFFLLILQLGFGQIKPFTFSGNKIYTEGNQIAYFSIEGIENRVEADFIQKELVKKNTVLRFKIYDGYMKNHCMIELTNVKNETYIFNQLQTIQNNFRIVKSSDLSSYSNLLRNLYDVLDFPFYSNYGDDKNDNQGYKLAIKNWKGNNKEKWESIKHLNLDELSIKL